MPNLTGPKGYSINSCEGLNLKIVLPPTILFHWHTPPNNNSILQTANVYDCPQF